MFGALLTHPQEALTNGSSYISCVWCQQFFFFSRSTSFNPSNAQLNYIRHVLALSGAHHILHVSKISVSHRKFWPSQRPLSISLDPERR
jgi:hypothetical protein